MANPLIVRARSLGTTVAGFSTAQKVLMVLGLGVLALGGSALYRTAVAPTYTPLFSNLAPADASAIVDQLDSDGVEYQLEDGGTTIMVPKEVVSAERLKAASAGLPGSSDTGYALLDKQGMTSSQLQQTVTYQRAIEGELATTIKGIRGVDSAVVHLAIPKKTVFEDKTTPPTASVLVDTGPGRSLTDNQVQAIGNLVASSVPEMSVDQVSISDANGELLTASGDDGTGGANGRDDQTQAYQDKTAASIQRMLDKVVGPGKAVATVTAELNFDKTSQTKEEFTSKDGVPPLSEKTTRENYVGNQRGVGGALGDNGVLGMDQQEIDAAVQEQGGYTKEDGTKNNAVDKTTTATTLAPGSVKRQSVAVVVDTGAAAGPGVAQLQQMVTTAAGIDGARGDTLSVNQVAFNTDAADQAKKELAAAKAADAAAAKTDLYKQGAIAAAILLAFIIALVLWRRAAKRAARQVVDLGELEAIYRGDDVIDQDGAAIGPPAEQIALMPAGPSPAALRRAQVGEMVDESPAEVADVLRGWMGQR